MEKSRQSALINAILTIGHGDLTIYPPAVLPVEDPGLLAHLIAYTAAGKLRDVKVALPVCALRGRLDGNETATAALLDNAVAHLLLLPPRDLRRAAVFHDQLKRRGFLTVPPAGNVLQRGVAAYLRQREASATWFARAVVQDRHSLTWLYDHFHVRPSREAQAALFAHTYTAGSTLAGLALLKQATPETQAAFIQNHRVPFTVAVGAVSKATEPVILRALIDACSPTEVLTNAKTFQKWIAASDDAACRGALDAALARAGKSEKTETLKAERAAKAVAQAGDAALATRLQQVTEQQVERQVKALACNVLILADRSGSMNVAIETAKQVAALVARRVTGQVKLSFFNVTPQEFDATGKTLAEIQALTQYVTASGGTSIGCGLLQARQQRFAAELILVVSDGGENTAPLFVDAYRDYERALSVTPSVTFIRLPGESDVLTARLQSAGLPITRYEFADKAIDGYNLPAIVNALRPGAYGLLEDVLATSLLTVPEALARNERRYA